MSRIDIREYVDDAEEYEPVGDPATATAVAFDNHVNRAVFAVHGFRDGEELEAAAKACELLARHKHFDVRQWVN